jgi:DNA-binding LacI/PurR family transcriptional regulator
MTESRRPTSGDIAARAGVSRATVSYVLNGRTDKRVSVATRDLVLSIAAELDYVPNPVALALKTGRTNVVLFDMPYWPLGAPTVEGVSAVVATLEDLGYTALVHFDRSPDGEGLAEACRLLQPVGLISSGAFLTQRRVAQLRASGTIALVALHEHVLDHVPTIVFDQRAVGELAIDYLGERGHSRIIALMPRDGDETRYRNDRLEGALRSAARQRIHLETVDSTLDDEEVVTRLADAFTRVDATAIYAFNDDYARAAQGATHRLGRAIPDDIALLGCDDGPLARLGWPRLSSISPTNKTRWSAIARAVDDIIQERDVDLTPLAELRVMTRDTT